MNYLDLKVNGKDIEKEYDQIKYLGLYFDRQLNWNIQVKNVKKKLWNTYYKLSSITKKFKNITAEYLIRLIDMCVFSLLDYGLEIYSTMSDTLKEELQIIQNKILKRMLKLFSRTKNNILYRSTGIYEIDDRISIKCAQFFSKLIRSSENNIWNKRIKNR